MTLLASSIAQLDADARWAVRGDELFFASLAVSEAQRAEGVAAELLASVEHSAGALGVSKIGIDWPRDETLAAWYQRRGYYPGTYPRGYPGEGRGEGPSLLTKDLNAARQMEGFFRGWAPEFTGTLLFVIDGSRVLLIDKKTGHGAGKINAPGGKLEPGESPVACAVREVREEIGITVAAPRLHAELAFADLRGSQWFGYVFVARAYRGELVETAEARPSWHPLNAIPYGRMWEDDRVWLPPVVAGERVRGRFLFRAGRLLAHALEGLGEVDEGEAEHRGGCHGH
jgi:8-oxo-dGTP diphosphatase